MAGKIDLNKEISFGGKSRGKMPTKTTINLVPQKEHFLSTKSGIAKLVGGIVLALLILVFLVVKPLVQLATMDAKVASLQEQLAAANETIEDLGYIEEEYAHYTTEGMTAEELSRVDRTDVMEILHDTVIKNGAVKSWSLSENIVSLQVSGKDLENLNHIAKRLEEEAIVDRCVINTANRGSGNNTGGKVAVTFLVYLNDANTALAEEAGEEAE